MKLSRELCAYLAGLFDGEGSVSIISPSRKARGWNITATIGIADEKTLRYLCERVGLGSVYRSPRKPPCQDIYYWRLSCRAAETFLQQILPWLHVRRRQAEIALQFRDLIRPTSQGRKPLGVMDDVYRRLLKQQLRAENKTGLIREAIRRENQN